MFSEIVIVPLLSIIIEPRYDGLQKKKSLICDCNDSPIAARYCLPPKGDGEPLELRKYENPQPKGDEVLVKITACGVCHSDLHLADGYFDLGDGKKITLADRGTKLPFTPGHEITGTVVALGENVKDIKIGCLLYTSPSPRDS